ncbi:MAG: glycoside hydrolase family 13 protein [Chloroflexota bacterium]
MHAPIPSLSNPPRRRRATVPAVALVSVALASVALWPGLVASLAPGLAGAALAAGPAAGDGDIELTGLFHDSRDDLYRSPGGAVTAGTAVTLRARTLHDDATAVTLRLTDAVAGKQAIPMAVEASDVPCGDPAPAVAGTCDLWSATVETSAPTTLAYRFEVTDGDAIAYLIDDDRRDGGAGLGSAFDSSAEWYVTVYAPDFEPITWMRDAVVYQVFPDRYANGDPANDPSPAQPRYGYPDDPGARIQVRRWGVLPEQPPKGRDYYGGDLEGIRLRIPYLRDLGVTVLYLNPIFAAASNHRYDTRDYRSIDPSLGTQADWDRLVADADAVGIRIVLDGVFNHVSSDSPYFDRYGHFESVGACESMDSPYRSWFFFRTQPGGPCVGPDGPGTMGYLSWSNYDSLPTLDKRDAAVRDLVFDAPDSVATGWLRDGAAGWRLDVMLDGSFPDEFWKEFRAAVKAVAPDAPIVAEAWKRPDVLRFTRGDTADGAMGYRFRNAVLGYLGTIDSKGFPDDGESDQPPSVFAGEILSILEDSPAAAVASTMNILDSHDTERALWSLTPGDPTREARELDAANVEIGRARLRLASLVQFTMPGPPTIYYGDEIGMTGASDPDDRRTFPVLPGEGAGADGPAGQLAPGAGPPANELRIWYTQLAAVRSGTPVLRTGDVRFLLADDETRAVAWARSGADGLAIVAINPGTEALTMRIPLDRAGLDGTPLRDGVAFSDALAQRRATSAAGFLEVDVAPLSSALLVADDGQDLAGPAAPAEMTAEAGASGDASIRWSVTPDAVAWEVYRSPVARGGYVKLGATAEPSFRDAEAGGRPWHYAVRARDAAGNLGPTSGGVALAAPSATPGASAAQSPSASAESPATPASDASAGAPGSLAPSPAPSPEPESGIARLAREPLLLLGLAALGFAVGGALAWSIRRRRAGGSAGSP